MKTIDRNMQAQTPTDYSLTQDDVALLLSSDGTELKIKNAVGHIDVYENMIWVTCNTIKVYFIAELGQTAGSVEYDYGEAMMSEESCFRFLRDVAESLRTEVE